jgi:hypothetical protein
MKTQHETVPICNMVIMPKIAEIAYYAAISKEDRKLCIRLMDT